MSDLWARQREDAVGAVRPLAVRMRPRTLDDVAGQQHILGPGKLLRRMLLADAITSIILHGPPGTGKTSLAEVIAGVTRRHFERENASSVGVARIREVCKDAERRLGERKQRTILFLDEIHRFSRSQQDVLLGDVERGLITLIGATTENPLFACNSALVSRSTLFRLEPLTEGEIIEVLKRAIADPERGYGKLNLQVDDDALQVWAIKCDGDARRALTALEVAVLSSPQAPTGGSHGRVGLGDACDPAVRSPSRAGSGQQDGVNGGGPHAEEAATPQIVIDRSAAQDSIQQKAAVYDQTGDEHYDSASALIKSLRGSDPDAAIYWIARMLEGGEEPRFIARRMAILASEDVGNADPRAIMVAHATWELVDRIGMPEARITLAQCATYLALAPKSNASYLAIDAAIADVREGRTLPVPLYLRDKNSSPISTQAGTNGRAVKMRDRPGEKYKYSHDAQAGFTGQSYLGVEKRYYEPTDNGLEATLKARLEEIRQLRERDP